RGGVLFGREIFTYATLFDLCLLLFFVAIVGGRLGYVFLYAPGLFLSNPLSIVLPWTVFGEWTGFFGMSFFGGFVAVVLTGFVFSRSHKISFLALADFLIFALPICVFFGRIGNFLNGELVGRPTTSFFGMFFLQDPLILRHPSVLYEAFFEGVLLLIFLIILSRFVFRPGVFAVLVVVFYASARFFVEFFRQPDEHIGFIFHFFTINQVYSLGLIMCCVFFYFFCLRSYFSLWYTGK
ncbi:MAG: prolipoprotein diacylglyceryl transferase, partial [Candidatus Moranbacteria bacterium]|nr:prolipoprotein diacylglyceryl transferase [Candidatus Moranbacteria bacterium]